jgi:hypothetical protein
MPAAPRPTETCGTRRTDGRVVREEVTTIEKEEMNAPPQRRGCRGPRRRRRRTPSATRGRCGRTCCSCCCCCCCRCRPQPANAHRTAPHPTRATQSGSSALARGRAKDEQRIRPVYSVDKNRLNCLVLAIILILIHYTPLVVVVPHPAPGRFNSA